jgi:malate dehydrogenase (oxaloacetate-decarboxylating)(NADP+)
MFIFPGLGLAASLAGVDVITDKMLYSAAVACADTVTFDELLEGRTFPRINRIREVSHAVACAVINTAISEGQTSKITPAIVNEGISKYVQRKMYYPDYVPLVAPI